MHPPKHLLALRPPTRPPCTRGLWTISPSPPSRWNPPAPSLLFQWFVFFASRRRHTRSYGDWSSDVCSSDLAPSRVDLDHAATRRLTERRDGTIVRRAKTPKAGLAHPSHETADRPVQGDQDQRRSEGDGGDGAEQSPQGYGGGQPSRPAGELVPAGDRQEPDTHHETHDAGGGEIGDDAVAYGAETELAHDLNEVGGDEAEGAYQDAVATGHDSGRQQEDERNSGEEQAEGEFHGGRRRVRPEP